MFLRLSITTAGVFVSLVLSVAFALAQSAKPSPLAFVPSGLTHPFRDQHGRYSLDIPAGWNTTLEGDDPTFHDGPSWIKIRLVAATSATAAIDQVAALFRPQFTTFNTINRGNTTIAGRASHGLNVDGITIGGQRVSVLLTAQPAGPPKQYFVVVSATPVAQAPLLNISVMALANSVRFP